MTQDETNTLTVRVGDDDRVRASTAERLEAMERGEDLEDRHLLVLEDDAELQRLLRPTNLELLRVIRDAEPESMREASELVDRDFRDVHRNLEELEALNVISFESEGRAKRPIARFDEIDIQVSLTSSGPDVAPA